MMQTVPAAFVAFIEISSTLKTYASNDFGSIRAKRTDTGPPQRLTGFEAKPRLAGPGKSWSHRVGRCVTWKTALAWRVMPQKN